MNSETIEIAMADDHALVREAIKDMICCSGKFSVTIEADNGKELIEQIEKAARIPALCIIDIGMPEMNGYETLIVLKQRWPDLKVLVLTIFDNEYCRGKMINHGADGYLAKSCLSQELFYTIENIISDEVHIGNSDCNPLTDITKREKEFLTYCCSDMSYQQIASAMNITYKTADTYREKLFKKLNINSRAGLAVFAYSRGYITLNGSSGLSAHQTPH